MLKIYLFINCVHTARNTGSLEYNGKFRNFFVFSGTLTLIRVLKEGRGECISDGKDCYRVATDLKNLENLEKSGNLNETPESQGILLTEMHFQPG